MFCKNCGHEINENADVCLNCGAFVNDKKEVVISPSSNSLQLAAKVFMVIGTIFMGFFLIPLIWCIPMTISYFEKVKKGEKVSTAFKVCSLLFVSLLGGIFMLCDNDK